jgi:zinc transport system substrate-binding protein
MMRLPLVTLLVTLALPAGAEVPRVVTDIPPVQALVAQVMGDLGSPSLLLEKGADDLVVWIGPELTPWLDRALRATPAPALALLDSQGTQTRSFAEGESDDDGHGGLDPHAWLDPQNAVIWLDLITARLSEIDPEHATRYGENAAAAKARIAAMDSDIARIVAPLADQHFVTFHAAYGYFTAHYHLQGAASLALGDASAPGAARLKALAEQLQAGHYACAFPEIQHDPALLTQVMQGSATRLGPALDPVGSSLDFGPNAYDDLMRRLANSLRECLQP